MKSEIQKTKLNYSLRLALVLLTILLGISAAQAGTLTVNSNADSNVCNDVLTLREAMLLASGGNYLGRPLTTGERNQISGATFAAAPPPANCSFTAAYWSITSGVGGGIADNIAFSNGVTTIIVTSGLPNITWAEDIINGLKSDGTKAAIDGTAAGSVPGLRVIATVGFIIRNLIIKNFQYEGILVEGSDQGVYEGLEIFGNGRDGIALVGYNSPLGNYNSTNNRIGGTNPSQRNFIYSNGHNGISIITTPSAPRYPDQGNVIENNYIGLKDNNGNADFGNGWDGIYFNDAFGNRIGGDTAASRNVISGNSSNGILLVGNGSYSNRIVNNFVGTNKDGNAVIGNNQTGIALALGAGLYSSLSQPNRIGDVGQGNVIAGNFFGIGIFDANTDHNIVRGNFIGTDLGANLNLGNVRDGVYINNAANNTIGGGGVGEGNVMAFNGGAGVYIEAGINNALRRNSIFLNSGLGIDLHPFGVTVNDPGDFDLGPNNLLNFPLIGSGSSGGGFTNLSGAMGSTANTAFTLDFFVSPDRDPSGYGEGSTYIGSTTVTTDNFGFAGYSVSFNPTLNYSGFYATATATDPDGNTSEFSPATRIGCSYSISSSSQNFGVAGGSGSFNLTAGAACDWQAVRSDNWITITGGASGAGNGTVSFSVAANPGPARTGTITVGGRLFTITQASSCTYQLSHFSAGYPASGTNSDGASVIAAAGCTWAAVSNAEWITINSGSIGNGNGATIWSVSANTGLARQGTVTVAGATFTINQAAAPRRAPFDFDGDGKTDIGIFRPSDGSWWYVRSIDNAFRVFNFGTSTDILTPGDFTGDGKADIAIFRPSSGFWYVQRSEDNSFFSFPFGTNGDIPVPADYDADGKADAAVFRPSNSTWYILNSGNGTTSIVGFGSNGDKPVVADYDGDGRSDIAIWRPSDGSWWYLQSSNSQFKVYRFGVATDKPVQGDYTGDGKADIAVWRPSTGEWFVQRSEDNSYYSVPFGTVGDVPAPGDYDGDGKFDPTVFRPSDTNWYVSRSAGGTTIQPFGNASDKPIPAAFIP